MIKRIIISGLIVLFSTAALAVDGEVFFGVYDRTAMDTESKYIGVVEVGKKIGSLIRPYVRIETYINAYNDEDQNFHPANIRFETGIGIYGVEGFSIQFLHSCQHHIDEVGDVENYSLILLKYEFGK